MRHIWSVTTSFCCPPVVSILEIWLHLE